MVIAASTSPYGIRTLNDSDLKRVIDIDQTHTNQTRRRFFEKRFAAAKKHPDDFIHIGIARDSTLCGFASAHILTGEFGHEHKVAVLDAIGVELESQERGMGHELMKGLFDAARRLGVHSLQSQAVWNNHGLMRFFATSGFKLAPRLVLERSAGEPLPEPGEDV